MYATIDAQFDETYFPFRTTNQRVYGQDYTPALQLEQLSLYHDVPNPTVADIVEKLQSTAVLCDTDWALHNLLQVPAAFEEQQPLDLEAMRSGDAENSISGVPPSVTIGPAGGSDGTLKGYQPGYKPVTGTASSLQKCIPFLAVTMISSVNLASIFGWRPATRGSRNCLRWAFSSLWTRMTFLPAT